MPRSGAGESVVGNKRLFGNPAILFPCKPLVAFLVKNTDRTVEELGQLDSPAGSAFNGAVRLNPADGDHMVTVVDHMENRLDDLADLFRLQP
jgi:hypothetical protein